MATVSYEILTKVKKAFSYKNLRAYVFTAQIIVKEMTPHNFVQLGIPVEGTVAVFPLSRHIPAKKELTSIALKTAITKMMTVEKKQYEEKLQPEKETVTLTASGNYKDTLSTIKGLSK